MAKYWKTIQTSGQMADRQNAVNGFVICARDYSFVGADFVISKMIFQDKMSTDWSPLDTFTK